MAVQIIGRDEAACRIGERLLRDQVMENYRAAGGTLAEEDIVLALGATLATLEWQADRQDRRRAGMGIGDA